MIVHTLMLLGTLTQPEQLVSLVKTAPILVRAQVVQTCSLSATGALCRGAAHGSATRIIDSRSGITIFEF